MLNWVLGNLKGRKKKKKPRRKKKKPSYEQAKKIAAKGSASERAELASYEDLEPEFLYFFASDEDASVRLAVAENDGSPLQADLLLAKDMDENVREELAYKIGRLVPALTPDESESLAEMAFQVLEILAEDQLPSIRAIVADEIKHLDNIPKRIINRLAHDAEEAVAGPILEYSQLLSDDQILQIVTSGLRGGALEAVARRKGLSGDIAEAVFEKDEDPATVALLENKTAEISEKLMDEIAIRAESRPDLHLPLVDRGSLSPMTLRRIATFVSNALVDKLIDVNALDSNLAKEIRLAVRERIETGEATEEDGDRGAARADRLFQKDRLDDLEVLDAIDAGDIEFLRRGLSLLSELPETQVTKMLSSESAKGLCALSWKAGLGAGIGVSLQRRIGKIAAKSMIHERRDGGYEMDDDELQWYVDYFE